MTARRALQTPMMKHATFSNGQNHRYIVLYYIQNSILTVVRTKTKTWIFPQISTILFQSTKALIN